MTKLLAALIAIDNSELLREIMNLGTVEVLLDLFFKYVWNNFLHAQVQQCIANALRVHVKPNEADDETTDNVMHTYVSTPLCKYNILMPGFYILVSNLHTGYLNEMCYIDNPTLIFLLADVTFPIVCRTKVLI